MDTRGNIQAFPTSIEALAEGFDIHLTADQAKVLEGLSPKQRHAALVRMRFESGAQVRKRAQVIDALDAQARASRKANELRRKRSKAARRARKRSRRRH